MLELIRTGLGKPNAGDFKQHGRREAEILETKDREDEFMRSIIAREREREVSQVRVEDARVRQQ